MSYSIIQSLTPVTQETLTPQVDENILKISRFFRRIFRDSSGVFRDKYMGEGWKVRKTFQTGTAGAFEYQPMSQAAYLTAQDTGNPNFQVYGTTAQRTFPGADVSGAPAYFNWLLTLNSGLGNMHMPLELLRHAELNAALIDQFANIIKATARTVAYGIVNPFFAESVNAAAGNAHALNGVLGKFACTATINGTNLVLASKGVSVAQTLGAGGSIRRITDGMRVELWENATSTSAWTLLNTAGPLFVTHTDTLANTFKLVNVSDSAVTFTASRTYYILPYKAYGTTTSFTTATWPYLPMSLERLLISTGYLYGSDAAGTGAINVDNAPWFKSYVQSVGSALDENTLRRYVARMAHARDNTMQIDTLLASEGVWSGYADNIDGIYTFDRNGQNLNIKGGMSNGSDDGTFMYFEAFGQRWRCMWDPWPAAGTLYGLKTDDRNFKMMVPPRLPRAGSNTQFDSGVEFVWPAVSGTSSIFGPTYNTAGALTDMVQAPFYYPFEFVPDVIPGMKLTGITESYGPVNS